MKRDTGGDIKKQSDEVVAIADFKIAGQATKEDSEYDLALFDFKKKPPLQKKAAPPPLPGTQILAEIMNVMSNWYKEKRRVRHKDGAIREVEVFQSAARWAKTKVNYNNEEHSLIRLEIIAHDPKDPAKKSLWADGAKETMENLAKEIDRSGILKTVKTNVTGVSIPEQSSSVVPVTVTNPKTGEKSEGNGFFLIVRPVGERGRVVFEKLKKNLEESMSKSPWDTTKGVKTRAPESRSR